jgi:hypothetical protein
MNFTRSFYLLSGIMQCQKSNVIIIVKWTKSSGLNTIIIIIGISMFIVVCRKSMYSPLLQVSVYIYLQNFYENLPF